MTDLQKLHCIRRISSKSFRCRLTIHCYALGMSTCTTSQEKFLYILLPVIQSNHEHMVIIFKKVTHKALENLIYYHCITIFTAASIPSDNQHVHDR